MNEIAPGVLHWTAKHPDIGIEVSAYALVQERVLLNPLTPSDGELPEADVVVLNNALHLRDTKALGLPVYLPRDGLYRLEGNARRPDTVEPYGDGDELPGGMRAFRIGGLSPDEYALLIPQHRAVAIADGVMRMGDGPLRFVPDNLMDDPDRDKRDLREGLGRLLDAAGAVEHLLLAHGDPWVGGGGDALRRFLDESA